MCDYPFGPPQRPQEKLTWLLYRYHGPPQLIGCSWPTVKSMVLARQLPAVRVNRRWKIDELALYDWIARSRPITLHAAGRADVGPDDDPFNHDRVAARNYFANVRRQANEDVA